MNIISLKNSNFDRLYKVMLKNRKQILLEKNYKKINSIINQVKLYGDKALVKYTNKFDNIKISSKDLKLNASKINKIAKKADLKTFQIFKFAYKQIWNFHKKQYPENYKLNYKGIKSSLRWLPIDSVGLYIPGGRASYPSSLLMSAIPAIIAGVKRIIICSPSYKGSFNPYFMKLIQLLKIKEVYQIGGAQAIAAMTYGTKSIKPVNKIFGPGNSYVTLAKKQLFGQVGIDSLAGPSEILVVADKKNNPEWIASDIVAQAEHDELSQCFLITDDLRFAKQVVYQINKLIFKLNKSVIIRKSLNNYGRVFVLKNLNNVYKLINEIAPEHVHLQCSNAKSIYSKINNAGAVFIGSYTPVVFGDYVAGTNHVIPTNGSAKFNSSLNVLDFMKRNSCVEMNKNAFKHLSKHAKKMAEVEDLLAHKLSVQIRRV